MKTNDYKRGYSKGYNTGRAIADRLLAALYDQQKRLVERVERAEKKLGLGHCEDCSHWTKACEKCTWGYCSASNLSHAGTPYGTWIRGEEDIEHRDARVITAMRFGCVLFQGKENHGTHPD